MSHLIEQADALDFLRSLPDELITLVVTDPPYASLEKHRKHGTTTRLKKRWFPVIPNTYYPELLSELYRVLEPNSHCYVMCDDETSDIIKPIGEAAGFTWWKRLVWNKIGRLGMGYHYRACHEFILFFEKGKRRLNDLSVRDVLDYPQLIGKQYYPTEKPVELLEVLIRQSSLEADAVLDPFCGSGATGEAALRLGRNFLGCDLDDSAVRLSRDRLDAI
jgi:site-specific DNA-methyltransferase (adenine-specific)